MLNEFWRRYYFCGSFMFCLSCVCYACARLFICALWSPAGKGLTSWLSFVVSNYEFANFPLVSWVRCGTWLNRFLIFAPLLTLESTEFFTSTLLRRSTPKKYVSARHAPWESSSVLFAFGATNFNINVNIDLTPFYGSCTFASVGPLRYL